ncbi:MAG: hypothetical protein O8C64_00675 [Candidatus Methanoperedens sp.]|nr:hypothetical protein [Candidatus Methanoperedens sp.]
MEQKCAICQRVFSEPIPPSGSDVLCNSCKEIVDLNKDKDECNATEVKNALIRAVRFDKESKKFISFNCFYTDIPCKINLGFKENNNSLSNAFNFSLDHKNPTEGDKGEELVVCLKIINQMKSNVPSDKFKEIVKSLAKSFEEKIDSKTLENELKKIIDG